MHTRKFSTRKFTERIRTKYPLFVFLPVMLACWSGCAPKIYHPPPMGAEYRFDEGLKPEKHPQKLFDKKMQRYLEDQGEAHPETRPAATTPAPKANPAPSDSSHSAPH